MDEMGQHLLPDQPPAAGTSPLRFAGGTYPGPVAWQWAFARALIRPLAACMLPVMVAALVAVLQGLPALVFLTVGFPLAVSLAALWTFYRMQATVAEVYVVPGAAAVRSVWESLHQGPVRWRPILELRESRTTLTLALGDAAYELHREDWPDADVLLAALRAARDG